MPAVRPAGEDDREFGREGDTAFGDRRFLADSRPGARDFFVGADPGLALAVVTVAAGLQDERKAKLGYRSLELGQ